MEIKRLTRLGDFEHNMEVLSTGKGELILLRRPTDSELERTDHSDYGPRPDCKGFFTQEAYMASYSPMYLQCIT